MPDVSSYFWEQCQILNFGRDPQARRVYYGGLDDGGGSGYLDNRVLALGRLKQDADRPIFPDYRVALDNRDLGLNHLINSNWIGQDLEVEFGFRTGSGYDTINIFTGFGREMEGSQDSIRIQAEGKFAHLSRKMVGTTNSAVTFTGSNWNPADLLWTVVTCYGELDGTLSSANPDIDYDSWSTWKDGLNTFGITVQGAMEDDNVLSWMQDLALITDSWIFENQARIDFNFFTPLHPNSFSPLIINESHYNAPPEVTLMNQVNRISVYNRFDPVSKVWLPSSPVLKVDSDSIDVYGAVERTYNLETVWHSSSFSAFQFADRKMRALRYGLKTFRIKGDLPLWPFFPGTGILFDCKSWGVNSASYRISGRQLDPGTRKISLGLESAEMWSQWFFLDDPVLGLLDQDYNPLY